MKSKILTNIKDGIMHPIIYTAIVAGACHIIQSHFYKNIFHLELNSLLSKVPWIIVGVYASLSLADDLPEVRKKMNPTLLKYLNPLYWNLTIILTVLISILVPYLDQQ